MKIKHIFEYSLVRLIGFIFQLFPTSIVEWLGRNVLGALLWYVIPYRFSVAFHNLGVVFPEMSRNNKLKMMREIYSHYGYVFATYYVMHRQSFRKRILAADLEGKYKTHRGLEEGKGSIYCVTHYGHWEAFIAFFTMNSYPFTGIYKIQRNPLTDKYFIKHREKFGLSIKHLSSKAGTKAFSEILNKNEILGIAIDQNFRKKGISVQFFGREFKAARGAALLYLRHKSPVFLSTFYIENKQFIYEEKKIDLPEYHEMNNETVTDIMQRLMEETEITILKHPEQWLWFHKVWQDIYSEKIKRSWREYLI